VNEPRPKDAANIDATSVNFRSSERIRLLRRDDETNRSYRRDRQEEDALAVEPIGPAAESYAAGT